MIIACNCECCKNNKKYLNLILSMNKPDIQTLWDKIKHGDEEHRTWLKKELENFFNVNLTD